MKELAVVIPVYNEEASIELVINKCIIAFDKLNIDYNIFAYNDGSKDNTAHILEEISKRQSKVIVVNKLNTGHGATIIQAYKDVSPSYTWIFQIDSDDEMDPSDFFKLWEKRTNYDFLVGIRDNRIQSLSRKIISYASRICVKLFYGNGPKDVNSPYRLMRTEKFIALYNKMPDDTFAPNIIISGYVTKAKLKFYQTLIPCRHRVTGEVSIKKWKLFKAALKSFFQTIIFSFSKYM